MAIVLKAGNGFGLFKLDTAFLAGDWSVSRDLSHSSIWYTGSPAPVPLPASAVLLIGGLGALAALRRRRRG